MPTKPLTSVMRVSRSEFSPSTPSSMPPILVDEDESEGDAQR